jgi:hypothetical protein
MRTEGRTGSVIAAGQTGKGVLVGLMVFEVDEAARLEGLVDVAQDVVHALASVA